MQSKDCGKATIVVDFVKQNVKKLQLRLIFDFIKKTKRHKIKNKNKVKTKSNFCFCMFNMFLFNKKRVKRESSFLEASIE